MSNPRLPLFDPIDSNLSFLVLEVSSQVENVRGFLQKPAAGAGRRIALRDDYVDNLKRLVEEQCFRALLEVKDAAEPATNLLRATITVAQNLERLGDLCVGVIRQAAHMSDRAMLQEPVLHWGLTEVLASVQLVRHALVTRNVQLSQRICRAEKELDDRYTETLENTLEALDSSPNREDLITFLNMMHYLERMGDLLMNIGEAVLFAAVGARLKLDDYVALTGVLESAKPRLPPEDMQIEQMWDSRSGGRVGRVFADGTEGVPDLIAKEGSLDKLLRERESIVRWETRYPGLVPRVFGYREGDAEATLLMEYLQGKTLQAVMLTGGEEELRRAYTRFSATVRDVWSTTRADTCVSPEYVAQIRARLDDVCRLHPSFFLGGQRIGSACLPSLCELLGGLAEVESSLQAPFSVWIHGDFNTNNIIYDAERDQIHFIDLYRSVEGDYLQDASVFLVSCFRIPVFEEEMRSKLNAVSLAFLDLVRDFARENGDETMERRLALGLARSFVTSTRFIPDPAFAGELIARATYIMERLSNPERTRGFRIPAEVVLWKKETAL